MSICTYPQKNKKQFVHFKNAKEREPKEINTSVCPYFYYIRSESK